MTEINPKPNLTLSTPISTTTSETSSIFENSKTIKNNNFDIKTIIENKYVKAVLYIILILYASVIAPKLPKWLIPYLENNFVKIFIVFIIGLLATKDPVAAIIATIGVTITYLFISDSKVIDHIEDIYEEEEDEEYNKHKNDENCNDDKKKSKDNSIENFNVQSQREKSQALENEYFSYINYIEEQRKKNKVRFIDTSNNNIEHFNTKRESTKHNVEYFDVSNNMFSNNNIEHFNTKKESTKHNVEYFDVSNNMFSNNENTNMYANNEYENTNMYANNNVEYFDVSNNIVENNEYVNNNDNNIVENNNIFAYDNNIFANDNNIFANVNDNTTDNIF